MALKYFPSAIKKYFYQRRIKLMKPTKTNKIMKTLLVMILLLGLVSTIVACTSEEPSPAPAPAPEPAPAPALPKPANPEIIMASTTSTRDSGLMDVLIPVFQQKTGYTVKPIYVGSGAAMTMGQQGNADVLLVHSPTAELTFMQNGYGINRRLIMHNDFIIVGPPSDPAGIKGMTSAVDAMKKISDAAINFYSRGDNSGTDALEKSLWKKIGVSVADNSTSNPKWYIEGGTGTGMLDLLRIASEKVGYTITDRSTYLANQKVLSLDVLVQGDPVLLNVYHVIQVNPDKFPKVNADGARAFSDFMVNADTQALIAKYGMDKYGQPLFFADAGKTEAELGSK
jgi:tungstate transport system substrate-binding protein